MTGRRQMLFLGKTITLCPGKTPVRFKVVWIGDAKATVGGQPIPDENDRSVCLLISFRKFRGVSCGDLNGTNEGSTRVDVESQFASMFSNSDLLRANHHAGRASNNNTWLRAIRPKVVVVTKRSNTDCNAVRRMELIAELFITRPDCGLEGDGDIVYTTDGRATATITGVQSGRSERVRLHRAARRCKYHCSHSTEGGNGMIDPAWAYTLAAVTLLLVTVILHVLAKAAFGAHPADKRRGMLALLVGADNRVSTSKLQVLMWTYAIAFVLLAIVWEGRADDVLKHGLETQYLFLLGIPVVGAAGSSLITTNKLQAGKVDKPTDPSKKAETVAKGIGRGLADVVTDDTGQGDLGDFQYFLFNLVALTYFFVAFFAASPDLLPTIPDTLVALTGASAFAYLSKKGVATNEPKLTGVYPSTAKPGDRITIRGVNLLGPSSVAVQKEDPSRGLIVLIGGVLGKDVSVNDQGIVNATVPDMDSADDVDLAVVTAAGVQTDPLHFKVVKPAA